MEVANNITRISLKTSKNIINNVERIKLLTNQTLEDVRVNLDLISSALDGFADLTQVNILEEKRERFGTFWSSHLV